MKKTTLAFLLLFMIGAGHSFAQEQNYSERYGRTLNLGIGIGGYSGYYGYIGHALPVFHLDYELDVARNFTIAPFLTFYTYRDNYYRETVIPVGIKGSYYFDNLLNANSNWDFYLAGSLGFSLINRTWDLGHDGDLHAGKNLFLDLHVGAEYHLNSRLGLFLDLSTGVSTVGLAIH